MGFVIQPQLKIVEKSSRFKVDKETGGSDVLCAGFQNASVIYVTLTHIIFPNWKTSSPEENSQILCLSVIFLYNPYSYKLSI